MKNYILRLSAAIALLMAASVPTHAQTDWEPICVWPFAYKTFRPATVETGLFKKTTSTLPCNIHVGKNALWFSKDNESLMEAIPDNVRKVTFENGDVYMPIGTANIFGKVLYDGELQGKKARVYMTKHVLQDKVDQQFIDYINKTQNMLQGASGAFFSHLADTNGSEDPEKMPVPMENVFYYQFNGEVFEATTKNILAHIKPERKKEYNTYTRTAEVLSFSEKSMMKVWEDFFVNYEVKGKK